MSYKTDLVYTENPYVDILIYNCKMLGMDTILKMDEEANAYETEESFRAAEKLIMCKEGSMHFEFFDSYSESVLRKAGITGALLARCKANKNFIPESMRPNVLKLQMAEFLETYEEQNYYYRKLAGLPPMGKVDYVENWVPPEGIEMDLSVPIHLMDDNAIKILYSHGVIDNMYAADKHNRAYMLFLDRRVDPYIARKAGKFAVLYIPTIDSAEIEKEYRDRLESNKNYVLKVLYSEAYKYDSDYYDNIMAITIVLNAMMDVISRVQEFIARKEVFDLRTCQYVFESYGVEFFPTIPLRYQIKMVKNLHTLLKYKSTTKCMVDICRIFGFRDIKIFKHYLLRTRKYNKTKLTYSFTGDALVDFDLKFVKIPIDEDMNAYMRDTTYHEGYDDIVAQDPVWNGGLNHEDVKRQHAEQDFNYSRTKYLSVENIYDIAKMSAQNSYFFNILYDDVTLEDRLLVDVSAISNEKQFRLCDIFTFLAALTHYYYGMKDLMLDTQGKVLYVNGFNFKADLALIAEALGEMQYSEQGLELLKQFDLPTTQYPSISQLMNTFVNNMNLRDQLAKCMINADSLDHYMPFKKLYDALMTIELTLTHYQNPETGDFYRDSEGDATYKEYLRNVDPVLYYKLMEFDLIDDDETKNNAILTLIDNVVYTLEQWIDMDKFAGLLHGLPGVSVDAIKTYIMMVINFYKSYKVHILGINTIYYFDDKLEGWLQIIDKLILHRFLEKDEVIHLVERIKRSVKFEPKEKVALYERIWLDITTWVNMHFDDWIYLRDVLVGIFHVLEKDDEIILDDVLEEWKTIFEPETAIQLLDFQYTHNRLEANHNLGIRERIWISTDTDPSAFAIYIAPETGKIYDRDGNLLWPKTTTSQVFFNLFNVEVPAGETITIEDYRIDRHSVATFFVNSEFADLPHDVDVSCADGAVTVTSKSTYDIIGTLRIQQ